MRVRILKKSKNEEGYEKTINLNSQGSADLMSAPPGQEIFPPGKKKNAAGIAALFQGFLTQPGGKRIAPGV